MALPNRKQPIAKPTSNLSAPTASVASKGKLAPNSRKVVKKLAATPRGNRKLRKTARRKGSPRTRATAGKLAKKVGKVADPDQLPSTMEENLDKGHESHKKIVDKIDTTGFENKKMQVPKSIATKVLANKKNQQKEGETDSKYNKRLETAVIDAKVEALKKDTDFNKALEKAGIPKEAQEALKKLRATNHNGFGSDLDSPNRNQDDKEILKAYQKQCAEYVGQYKKLLGKDGKLPKNAEEAKKKLKELKDKGVDTQLLKPAKTKTTPSTTNSPSPNGGGGNVPRGYSRPRGGGGEQPNLNLDQTKGPQGPQRAKVLDINSDDKLELKEAKKAYNKQVPDYNEAFDKEAELKKEVPEIELELKQKTKDKTKLEDEKRKNNTAKENAKDKITKADKIIKSPGKTETEKTEAKQTKTKAEKNLKQLEESGKKLEEKLTKLTEEKEKLETKLKTKKEELKESTEKREELGAGLKKAKEAVDILDKINWGAANTPIGPDSAIWNHPKLHPSLKNARNRILGYRNDGHGSKDHRIYAKTLEAVNKAAHEAERRGYKLVVTSGNRHGVSRSHRHGQRGGIGSDIDFTIQASNGKRAPLSVQSAVMKTAANAGATNMGFGANNGAGHHVGYLPSELKRGRITTWSYDSGGRRIASAFGKPSIVR